MGSEVEDIIRHIERIVEKKVEAPQEEITMLILVSLRAVLKSVDNHAVRLEHLEKYKPYLQILAVAMSSIGLTLLGMLITGKLQITIVP